MKTPEPPPEPTPARTELHYLPLSQLPSAATGHHAAGIDHLLHWPHR